MSRCRLVALAPLAAALILAGACGDGAGETGDNTGELATQTAAVGGGGPAAARSPSTGGTEGGPEPVLEGPSARFTIQHETLTDGIYRVDVPNTYIVTQELFSTNAIFQSAAQGDALTKEWGFVEGYQAQFAPDGLLAGVLQGGYYLTIETLLFETAEGAEQAYNRFEGAYGQIGSSQRIETAPLGNQSSAWAIVLGTVGRTEVPNVYHRFIVRRGNLLAMVQTNGAQPYMSIDIARDYAVIIDDQALGHRPAVLPTPAPAGTPGVN